MEQYLGVVMYAAMAVLAVAAAAYFDLQATATDSVPLGLLYGAGYFVSLVGAILNGHGALDEIADLRAGRE